MVHRAGFEPALYSAPNGEPCQVRRPMYKMVAGAAFESAAYGYEPYELPHTLPGNEMDAEAGI